jgi:hypothetical protein
MRKVARERRKNFNVFARMNRQLEREIERVINGSREY